MKKNTKILALIMAAAMLLGLLGACSGTEAPQDTETTVSEAPASQAPAQESEAPEAAEPADADQAEEPQADAEEEAAPQGDVRDLTTVMTNVYSLPIVEDSITYTIYSLWVPVLAQLANGHDESFVLKELEARTNVHLEWSLHSTETSTEDFNLMVLSGEWCDLIEGGGESYTGGADAAVEEDFILDITPYITEDQMPNFYALYNANGDVRKAMISNNGYISGFPKLLFTPEGTPGGMVARKDWMDELGLDIPTTYDDYHDMLTAFKNEKGATNALLIPYSGYLSTLWEGYGVAGFAADSFYVKDGVVDYAAMDSNFVELVTMFAEWYAEGIIDPDYITRTTTRDADSSLIMSNAAGIWDSSVMQINVTETQGGFPLQAIPKPLKDEKGTDFLQASSETWIDKSYSLSVTCHDIDILVKYIDYLYSVDGSFLCNFGTEGDTFNYDENGDPVLTDLILNHESGLPTSLVENVYTVGSFIFVYDWEKYHATYTETQKAAYAAWNSLEVESDRYYFPSAASMDTDASSELTNIMSDITTYLDETYSMVIMGEAPVSKLDEIASQLESMNIARAIELKQAAYDAYISK